MSQTQRIDADPEKWSIHLLIVPPESEGGAKAQHGGKIEFDTREEVIAAFDRKGETPEEIEARMVWADVGHSEAYYLRERFDQQQEGVA